MSCQPFAWLMVICFLGAFPAAGSELQVLVKDQSGRPVESAIVWAQTGGKTSLPPLQTQIIQKNRQFLPAVTVVPVGSAVRFPNQDNVQHHVYSFSFAKTFDIPLYIGESPQTIQFDRPGIVTLGCNIHDWMAAYVVVLDTGVFAQTDAKGIASLRNLPGGPVIVCAWYPRLRGEPVKSQIEPGQSFAELTLTLRPAFRRTPPDDRGGYR
ncbi:MAG TPA: methylamine utilization protein [Terrimicrobium sp.]